ncbi:porin family protein [Flavobacterium silvaticum]|uniref:PorT family protein n=1 Tax=Flavobacterium silvaticum TaxID=1852020 RepID=A0A972JIN5_9FLAO|nr:porin family protein [Flavobacterium silvaticum]NMH27402.1 PorT family protein [Flavobacterium silvaticum]
MKYLLFLVGVLCAGIQQSNGQSTIQKIKEKLDLGVKVEGSASDFTIRKNPALKSDFGAGGALGTIIRFNVSDHFAIQEDIMFVYHTSDLENNGVKDTFQYFGTEVPIYLMVKWKTLSGGRFFVGTGPYFGFGFSGKYKESDIDVFKKYNGQKPEMKRLSNGLAANIGYELSSRLQVNATCKYGFNVLDRDKDNYRMSAQSISLGLGYTF